MPVKTRIDTEHRLTIVEYIEPWTLEEFYDSFSGKVTAHRLADLTRAGPLDWVDIDVLRKIARHAQRYDAQRDPGGRTAFLVTEAYARPLLRLFQALTEGEQSRSVAIRVFANRDDAMAWLLSAADDSR